MQCCRGGYTLDEYSGMVTSPDWLVMLCLMHTGWGLPSELSGHTVDSHLLCCQPAPPDPFPQDCAPATPFPGYACAWHYSVLAAESGIFFSFSVLCHLILQFIKIPLQGLSSLKRAKSRSQCGMISRLTNGAFDSCVQIFDKNTEQSWSLKFSLVSAAGDRSPARYYLQISGIDITTCLMRNCLSNYF